MRIFVDRCRRRVGGGNPSRVARATATGTLYPSKSCRPVIGVDCVLLSVMARGARLRPHCGSGLPIGGRVSARTPTAPRRMRVRARTPARRNGSPTRPCIHRARRCTQLTRSVDRIRDERTSCASPGNCIRHRGRGMFQSNRQQGRGERGVLGPTSGRRRRNRALRVASVRSTCGARSALGTPVEVEQERLGASGGFADT